MCVCVQVLEPMCELHVHMHAEARDQPQALDVIHLTV